MLKVTNALPTAGLAPGSGGLVWPAFVVTELLPGQRAAVGSFRVSLPGSQAALSDRYCLAPTLVASPALSTGVGPPLVISGDPFGGCSGVMFSVAGQPASLTNLALPATGGGPTTNNARSLEQLGRSLGLIGLMFCALVVSVTFRRDASANGRRRTVPRNNRIH